MIDLQVRVAGSRSAHTVQTNFPFKVGEAGSLNPAQQTACQAGQRDASLPSQNTLELKANQGNHTKLLSSRNLTFDLD